MLLNILIEHPEALPIVLARTPVWVWGLLAGLVALGLSQLKARSAGLARVLLMPAIMSLLALYGVLSVFGAGAIAAWLAMALLTAATIALLAPAPGAGYDAASRRFTLAGSSLPLLLILGIFVTKYVVGVDTAMEPNLARESGYALGVSALYGLFSGVFLARTWGLLRLARRTARVAAAAA